MDYKIPLFDLNFTEAEEIAVTNTIRSKWISTGPKTTEFENMFSQMLDVENAIALSNCTVSLHLALKLVGVDEGDEVICPSLTFVATVNSIRYVNATPVFADICNLENLTIDPEDIRRKITSKTKAIVVMHYGGFSCDMDSIMKIADENKIKVIEDACHGPFSEYNGRKLGTIGDVGCFSFFSNKNISTGEGGMLVTNNSEYASRTRLLRSHGMTSMSYDRAKGHSTSYDVIELGFNYRMDDIRSTIGIVQLSKIKGDLEKRELVRKMYINALADVDNIIIPFKDYNHFSSNYIFPIVLKDSNEEKRDLVRTELAKCGIQTSVHYPAAHRFTFYQKYYAHLPITDYASNNLITLPMYSSLNFEDIKYICENLVTLTNE